jgi:hypothetical protein
LVWLHWQFSIIDSKSNLVEDYVKRKGDKTFCKLYDENKNNEYAYAGETTESLIRRLKIIYKINQSEKSKIHVHKKNYIYI